MITEVLVPGAMLAMTAYNIPAIKTCVDDKIEDILAKHENRKLDKRFQKVK